MSRHAIGRPMEVLLVEDSVIDARLTMGALREGGLQHRLTLVRDGAEATEFLFRTGRFAQAPTPDLILLDLLMPKKNGLEVLAELSEDDDLRKIPVIVLTAAEDDKTKDKCRHFGVENYITKPVDFAKFSEVVRKLKHHWHHDLILPSLE
jgi:CheY-like chemotaxis protein